MGLFDFFKKKKKTESDNTDNGDFLAFVLLSEPEWDRERYIADIKADWDITVNVDDDEEYKDMIVDEIGDMRLAVRYIGMPVPNKEAEDYAAVNYMWKNAVEVTASHKAQIMIAALGGGTPDEKGRLLVKAVSSALKQDKAIAVYSDGAVYEPEFYNACTEILKSGGLPVPALVWFGVGGYGRDEWGIYTFGMRKFGKEEMETYVGKDIDINDVRAFMCDIVNYVLIDDVTLKDGETIGFTADQKLKITLSKGISVGGKTLKIEYPV